MKKIITVVVLLCLVFGNIAFASQNEEVAGMMQNQNQMSAMMLGLLSGMANNPSGSGFDPNSESGKLLVQTLNAMVAQLVQQNKENPNEEATKILNMIVPLMQSVNGMVQQQAPARK